MKLSLTTKMYSISINSISINSISINSISIKEWFYTEVTHVGG